MLPYMHTAHLFIHHVFYGMLRKSDHKGLTALQNRNSYCDDVLIVIAGSCDLVLVCYYHDVLMLRHAFILSQRGAGHAQWL